MTGRGREADPGDSITNRKPRGRTKNNTSVDETPTSARRTKNEVEEENTGGSKNKRKPPFEVRAEHCSSPVRFAREVLGVDLWSKQEEVLEALRYHRRRSCGSFLPLGRERAQLLKHAQEVHVLPVLHHLPAGHTHDVDLVYADLLAGGVDA